MGHDSSTPISVNTHLAKLYNDEFYSSPASLRSARIFLSYLWKYLQATCVLDVGCGRGAWLVACHELGAQTLYGFDGTWNSHAKLMDSAIQFTGVDLNNAFSVPSGVDLAISLEVAEHLEHSSSAQFVANLTQASTAVLFGAACPGQGGTNHINEQPQSFWANLFLDNGYVPYDMFRPHFWSDSRVSAWYPQNTFLYLRSGSAVHERFISMGIPELDNAGFMDCVHPRILDERLRNAASFRTHAKDIVPSLVRAIRARA